MNKIIEFLLLLVIVIIFLACGGNVNDDLSVLIDRYHEVEDIHGNQLLLKSGYEIILLGIEDNQEVEGFLNNTIKSEVKVILDSENKPRRLIKNKPIYAYVVNELGESINAIVLKEKKSKYVERNVSDSSYIFQEYALRDYSIKEPEQKELVIEDVRASSFMVVTLQKGRRVGIGSGFFVMENGIGISNYHVFEGGDSWVIKLCGENKEYEVDKIYEYNVQLDYIIFGVSEILGNKYLDIANDLPSQGDDVHVYGSPRGLECTLTKGIVSALRESHVQIDAPISPGSSGSPVVNDKGEVIGIATKKRLECDDCNFAIDIQLVKNDLPSN